MRNRLEENEWRRGLAGLVDAEDCEVPPEGKQRMLDSVAWCDPAGTRVHRRVRCTYGGGLDCWAGTHM